MQTFLTIIYILVSIKSMILAEFHSMLRNSTEIIKLGSAVATEFARRNIAPLTGVEEYDRDALPTDTLADHYANLLAKIHAIVDVTDLDDDSSIIGQQKYAGLLVALNFAYNRSGQSYDTKRFARMALVGLLEDLTPGIDDYVDKLKDVSLLNELGLVHDDYMLVDVSAKSGFDLKRHGLVLSPTTLIYPHQFLRRHYNANFVNLLVKLRQCADDGLKVKLRIDPLRSWTDPRHHRDIIEKDVWFGRPFNIGILKSQERRELLTVHRTNDRHPLQYAVDFTYFRTSMMDDHQRQFMVEEYCPLAEAYSPSRKSPGVGTKYCIQKFGHFVYDQRSNTVNHLDAAVRVFDVEDYAAIFGQITSGRDPGSKVGVRHKLFLVEGSLNLERTQQLLYEFFMYNPHLEDYFTNS